jgi:hypothetical protein
VIASTASILWECHGIASGWLANSFRSEGVGQLSMLLFFEAYLDYHDLQTLTPPEFDSEAFPWLRIATGNQGLIDRIRSGLTTRPAFAGAALCSEYDIVNEINELERRLPVRLQWEHVKGHQDEKKQWYELTWMERLNVRADILATDGLAIDGSPSTIVSFIPSSKVGLRIDYTDVTSKYATHLRKAATLPATLLFTKQHYGWDEDTFKTIDWKAHHGALRKLTFARKKFITKFTHQLLPMGTVFHKIDPNQSAACSSCHGHLESHDHLYRCPSRRHTMTAFLADTLAGFLQDNYTCPALAHILLDSLRREIQGSDQTFQHRHGVNDERCNALLQAQTNIGWPQLFQGRLAIQWSQIQEEFLIANNTEFKLDRRIWTGDIWARNLISLIWNNLQEQWHSRNADRHGRTKEQNHAIRHAKILTS